MKKKLKLRLLLLIVIGFTTPALANVSSNQIIAPGTSIGLSIINDQQQNKKILTMEDVDESQLTVLIVFVLSVTFATLANYYYLMRKKTQTN